MKKNKLLIILLLISFFTGCIGLAFSIKKNSQEQNRPYTKQILGSSGSFFADTITATYRYIKSDYPAIYLDPRLKDQLIVEGWEDARTYIDSYVKNDTLFVIHKPSDYYRIPESKVNGEWTLLARIGAQGLKGIDLYGVGQIDHQARPTGARLDGTPVYNEEMLNSFKLNLEDLHIKMNDQAKAKLFLSANNITIESNLTSSRASFVVPSTLIAGSIMLTGEASSLHFNNSSITTHISASGLELDTLIVHESADQPITGSINANPKEYLEASLYGKLDIYYDGYVKNSNIKATGFGRVINTNKPHFDKEENNNSRKAIRDAVKVAQDIASKKASTVYKELTADTLLQILESGNRINVSSRVIRKDFEGNVLHPDSINIKEIEKYARRFFIDEQGQIQEIMFRERLPIDDKIDSLFQEQSERYRPITPIFINCNNTSQYWSQLKEKSTSSDKEDVYYHASLIYNLLSKCPDQLSSITLGQGQTILSILSKASPKFSKEVIDQLRNMSAKNIISSEELMKIANRVETYDNRFAADH